MLLLLGSTSANLCKTTDDLTVIDAAKEAYDLLKERNAGLGADKTEAQQEEEDSAQLDYYNAVNSCIP